MCTLSWMVDSTGYHVFFNRDEQKSREIAKPPAIFSASDVRYIMPVDPVGGGTWVSTNEYGVTVALLNYYQGLTPQGQLVSRGNIVKSLAACKCLEDAKALIKSMNMAHFAPFSLILFSPSLMADQQRVRVFRWDGRIMHDFAGASPLVSSAVEYERVSVSRQALYRDRLLGEKGICKSILDYYSFHASHEPEASLLSVCTHRDDAKTVSFSHIAVGPEETTFHYVDGSPCHSEGEYVVRFNRKQRLVSNAEHG